MKSRSSLRLRVMLAFACTLLGLSSGTLSPRLGAQEKPTAKEAPSQDPTEDEEASTQRAQGPEILTIEGQLEAIAGDRIKVKDEEGNEHFAVLTRSSKLKYQGTTDAKFLRPGYMVRFEAEFDVQKGIALTPVSEIEVFRPSQNRRMQPEERQSQTPGIYPVQTKPDDKEKPRNARQAASNLAAAAKRFLVVGQLRVIQPTKIQVLARNKPVIVDIQEDTKISVAAGDAMFCLPGDKVKLTALRGKAAQGLLQVETMEVEGAKPLGAAAGDKATGKQNGDIDKRSDNPNTRSRRKNGDR